jgi:hypothetical protein
LLEEKKRKIKQNNTGSMNDYFSEKTIQQNGLAFEFFLYSSERNA